jgi:hypothetical protein
VSQTKEMEKEGTVAEAIKEQQMEMQGSYHRSTFGGGGLKYKILGCVMKLEELVIGMKALKKITYINTELRCWLLERN